MRRISLLGIGAVLVVALVWIALHIARSENAFVARAPLPAPPSGPLKFAGTPSQHPFRRSAENGLERTIFQTPGPLNTTIEIRNLLVLTGAPTTLATTLGPVLLEVEGGAGTLSVNGQVESIGAGNTKTITAGQSVKLATTGIRPMAVRLFVFEGK